ncbi:MAG TPA: DNA repair protein RadA [Acidimicrobiia bacterium]|nr:DNA repair protein RadA [Acidimicrobiia bacterium]
MATRTRDEFRCDQCAAVVPKWVGRCPDCGAWDSLSAVVAGRAVGATGSSVALGAGPIADLEAASTGVGEFDRVLGGGVLPGSVTLIGGEPGIGKSTLVLQALAGLARAGRRCLLVTAEESAHQTSERAARVGANVPGVSVLAESSMASLLAVVDAEAPDVVAVDSIQAISDPDVGGSSGSITQVRECAAALVALAKQRDIAVMIVGHVTKDGDLAGPRALEHVVDTVIAFEGDRHHALRLLRALKHRFGATSETGVLEMRGEGLVDVPDPSELFLADRAPGMAGSVVAPVLEGARPVLVEVQALVTEATAPMPRRSVQGLEARRLAVLLAVLADRVKINVRPRDVYASVAGGIRVTEPGVDLALALAVASAALHRPVEAGVCVVGEVGLAGEVRQVSHASRRIAEAARLGFGTAIVPALTPDVPGVELIRVQRLGDAVALAGLR